MNPQPLESHSRRARQARRLIACYCELSKISVLQPRLPLSHLLLDAFTTFGQFEALHRIGCDRPANFVGFLQ